jgi:hypothetical protein
VFILLLEEHCARVDLTEMIMKDLHKSFHFVHQLAKKLSGLSRLKQRGLGMRHSSFL